MKPSTKRVVREEISRSAVWLFFGVFGWAVVLYWTAFPDSVAILAGLVAGTVLVMTTLMVGLRIATGEAFRSQVDLLFVVSLLFVGMYVVYSWVAGTTRTLRYLLVVVVMGAIVARIAFPGAFAVR